MVSHPLQLDRLMLSAAESVTVDEHTDLRELVTEVKDLDPENVKFATTPWTRTMMTDAGSSVELDQAGAQELFQAVIEDRPLEWLAAHPQKPPAP